MAEEALLRACHCCGLVQRVPPVPSGHRACCARCSTPLGNALVGSRSNQFAAGTAWAALLLYPGAMMLPALEIARFGHVQSSNILEGTVTLLTKGEVLVGLIVLVCSVMLPLLKLAGLAVLTTGGSALLSGRHRALAYRLIEWTGRWGMVDVLLVALLVAYLKIGDVVQVTAGPGIILFTVMVCLNLIASALFDPHALWDRTR